MTEELVKIKYHFEVDGRKVFTSPEYFRSEEQATEYYIKYIEWFRHNHEDHVNDFVLIKEEIYSKSEVVRKMHWVKYIIKCDSDIGELFVSFNRKTNMPYLSPFKSDVIENDYFSSKEDAECKLEIYKETLKFYYKDEVLSTLEIIEIEEE